MLNKLLVITCFLMASFVSAQLSGTYTIGGDNPDYVSVSSAVDDLVTYGMNGSVIFNIRSGDYNVQNVTINSEIATSMADQTITFQSEDLDASLVTLSGNNVFNLNNYAPPVFFYHLTFDVYSSYNVTYNPRRAFTIYGSNVTINNCVFTGGYSNANSYTNKLSFIYMGGNLHNITIQDNTFGSNGCAILNSSSSSSTLSSNFVITDNTFEGSMVTTLSFSRIEDFVCNNNLFLSNAAEKSFEGILLGGDVEFANNQIVGYNFTGGNQVNISSNSNYVPGTIVMTNNIFKTVAGGVYLSGFENLKIYNNSFMSEKNFCLRLAYSNNQLLNGEVYNNIFLMKGEYPSLSVGDNLNFNNLHSDHNAFVKETNAICNFLGWYDLEFYDFTDWQSTFNQDVNSFVVGDVYASETDFHTPNASMLDGTGISVAEVTTDFDGETRDTTTPDIGADEFTIDDTTYLDLEVTAIVSPINGICDNDDVVISVKNNSSVTVTNFDVDFMVNGHEGNIATYEIPIAPDETVDVTLTNAIVMYNTHYNSIAARVSTPNGMLDNNYSNNTQILNDVFKLGDFIIHSSADECVNNVTLTVPIIPNTTVLWSTNETTNSIVVTAAGTYSVTLTTLEGCTFTKDITIN